MILIKIFFTILVAANVTAMFLLPTYFNLAVAISSFAILLLFLNSRAIFWAILINVYFLSFITITFLPAIGKKVIWISDFALAIVCIKILIDFLTRKISLRNSKEEVLILSLLLVGTFSLMLNGWTTSMFIYGLRNYFKYVPFFLLIKYYPVAKNTLKSILIFCFVVAFLNIPIAVFQYLKTGVFDEVGGSFGGGGSGFLTLFQIIFISYLLIQYNEAPKKKMLNLLYAGLLFIPILINETKVIFFLLPFIFIFIFWKRLLKSPIVIVLLSVIFISSFMLISSIYSKAVNDFSINDLVNPRYLYAKLFKESYMREGGLNRLSALDFAIKELSSNPQKLLFGVGMGNASKSLNFSGAIGVFQTKYRGMNINLTFLSGFFWEFGIIGLVILSILLIRFYNSTILILIKNPPFDIKIFTKTFQLTILLVIFSTLYNSSLSFDQLGCLFWVMSGVVARVRVSLC